MRYTKTILIAACLVLQLCGFLYARETTSNEAQVVVTGWLKDYPKPLGMALGRNIARVETFTNDNGQPAYHIVYLQPSGFVIVPANDMIEPIIGFVNGSTYDPSPENPLGALLSRDLNGRIEAARNAFQTLNTTTQTGQTETQKKWKYFINLAEKADNEFELMDNDQAAPLLSVDDIRIAPLLHSKWNQSSLFPGINPKYCYNYYTPNHYPCGCVATAMAQLMYYYQYPDEPNDIDSTQSSPSHEVKASFQITVDGQEQTVYLMGGDGLGGPYKWEKMENEPNYWSSYESREAIGTICYDAGISVNMRYTPNGSSATLRDTTIALKKVFKYSNAALGYVYNTPGIIGMINPNLDARRPVILGIQRTSDNGHAVICDGYGFNTLTLYHHLNMGWSGQADCWYNLPNIDCSTYSDLSYYYTSVNDCIHNIYKSGTGEIISGRVLYDSGEPVENIPVYCSLDNEENQIEAITNSNGIFFFDKLTSNTTYTISAEWPTAKPVSDSDEKGEQTPVRISKSVQIITGNSRHNYFTSGNFWGLIFQSCLPELYVDDNAANDPEPNNPYISDPIEDGSSEHPFDAIQEAIDKSMPGDIITIRPGTYKGTGNRDIDFKGKPITVRGLSAAETIIDCEGSQTDPHRGFIFQSGERACSALKDLTITGGYVYDTYTDDDGYVHYVGGGGAICCKYDSSPKITNCTFRKNKTAVGGAIYCFGNANPSITNCKFIENQAYSGGGIYNDFLSNITVINCSFLNNKAYDCGGGMTNIVSFPEIINCIFSGNSAGTWGGGICNFQSSPILTNCTLCGNTAQEMGSGIYNHTVSKPVITNCIIWDNYGEQLSGILFYTTASYSNIQDGLPGDGNINADPLFVDADGDDDIVGTIDDNLRLRAGSPCINSGSNDAVSTDIDTDLEGNPRINNGVVDMGAYEY